MNDVLLSDFITLSNGSCYCIMNQKEIDGVYFAIALTVPDKIDKIKDAECRLLKVTIHENGKLSAREYSKDEKNYFKIMESFLEPIN